MFCQIMVIYCRRGTVIRLMCARVFARFVLRRRCNLYMKEIDEIRNDWNIIEYSNWFAWLIATRMLEKYILGANINSITNDFDLVEITYGLPSFYIFVKNLSLSALQFLYTQTMPARRELRANWRQNNCMWMDDTAKHKRSNKEKSHTFYSPFTTCNVAKL